MTLEQQMDAIYRKIPADRIPWNRKEPPAPLVELVESGQLLPCDAVDLGCGAGHDVVWLARRGFRMTGVDLSSRAIELAAALAAENGVECALIRGNLIAGMPELEGAFDFAFDWEVLHHVFPEDRESYVRNVHRMLRPGGRYLSVCFGEADAAFGGEGKYRTTPLGTELYFSSEEELRALFERAFTVEVMRRLTVPGTRGNHQAIMALLTGARLPADG